MRRRARALACGVAGAGAIAWALATVMPSTTGCTTHQCDSSSYVYGPANPGYIGKIIGNQFETNGLDEPWLDYPPNVTITVQFPFEVGRAPVSLQAYVGVSDQDAARPNLPGFNWTEAPGQLAQISFLKTTNGFNGFVVNNNTCAHYFARFVVTFAPDALVLFGGASGTTSATPLGDTWTWDGTAWTQSPSQGPSARSGAVIATLNNHMFLFGGNDGTSTTPHALQDMWTWDGASWTQLPSPPSPSDADSGALPWPSPRFDAASGVALATDPSGAFVPQIVMFGGTDGKNDLNDTWAWNGFAWTQQKTPTAPPARSGAGAAGLQNNVVVFGGSSNGTPLGDTWVWNKGWTQVQTSPTPGATPSPRMHPAAASYAGNMVLFGGNSGTTDLGDTWLWNGSTWTQAMPAGPVPPARSSAAMGVFGSVAVLFGGTSAGMALGDTWTWNGNTWTEQNVQGPSPRADAFAAAN